jgi:Pyridoxamine 5'-phosphate oxidase
VSTTMNHPQPTARQAPAAGPTTAEVWRELRKASFAVVSQVTPDGDPRSSGVVYTTIGRRMYVVVARDSWKARHIAACGRVAVTVPVRRGGIMSLLFPIPPATISFHGAAFVYPADSPRAQKAITALSRLLPAEGREATRVIEIRPEGWFLTYGVGVSLTQMRSPVRARARVPVA